MEIVVSALLVLHVCWFIGVVNNIRYVIQLRRFRKRVLDLPRHRAGDPTVKHLVGIPFYEEPIELMMDTLDSLASQSNARQKISIFAGMEEGTPNKDLKAQQLMTRYALKFERFLVTVHPKGLQGEIPGKCSNFKYGSRDAIKRLREDQSYGLDNGVVLLLTTGDCDTIFGDRYFDALEEDYMKLKPEQRSCAVWQSPLFYCINLDKSPFFVRVTGLFRSFFMMGYLIPWNINTMSVFSLSLKLYEDGDYIHPGYQMDDIIALIRWTCAMGRRCIVRSIPVATLSGPTSGKNYAAALCEWARQIRRWTIGAGEVFHYFMIKSTRLPATVAFVWAVRFIFYYGVMLCVASVYSITAPFITTTVLRLRHVPVEGYFISSETVLKWILLGMLALQYVWFLAVFVLNKLAESTFPAGNRDNTSLFRNILHWLLSWPTLTVYCLIELVAFLELTVRGKEVCSHNASKKDGLVKADGTASNGVVHSVHDSRPDRVVIA